MNKYLGVLMPWFSVITLYVDNSSCEMAVDKANEEELSEEDTHWYQTVFSWFGDDEDDSDDTRWFPDYLSRIQWVYEEMKQGLNEELSTDERPDERDFGDDDSDDIGYVERIQGVYQKAKQDFNELSTYGMQDERDSGGDDMPLETAYQELKRNLHEELSKHGMLHKRDFEEDEYLYEKILTTFVGGDDVGYKARFKRVYQEMKEDLNEELSKHDMLHERDFEGDEYLYQKMLTTFFGKEYDEENDERAH